MEKKGRIGKRWRKALGWFWAEVNKPLSPVERTSVRRLRLLRELAERNCHPHMTTTDLAARRRSFNRWASRHPAGEGQCFACLDQKKRQWHHIVQLQHGGPNRRENLVPVCARCHMKIHPWVEVQLGLETPPETVRPIWA